MISLEQKLFNHSFIIGWNDGYRGDYNNVFARENTGYDDGYDYYHRRNDGKTSEENCTPYQALANYLYKCQVER